MEKTRRGSAIRTPPTASGYTREPNNARAHAFQDAGRGVAGVTGGATTDETEAWRIALEQ